MIKEGFTIDIEVALLRNKLMETFNGSPLPITVKAMIANEFAQGLTDREKAHLDMILSTVSSMEQKGEEVDAANTATSKTEAVLGTAEDISVGQRSVSAGNVQSAEHTEV